MTGIVQQYHMYCCTAIIFTSTFGLRNASTAVWLMRASTAWVFAAPAGRKQQANQLTVDTVAETRRGMTCIFIVQMISNNGQMARNVEANAHPRTRPHQRSLGE